MTNKQGLGVVMDETALRKTDAGDPFAQAAATIGDPMEFDLFVVRSLWNAHPSIAAMLCASFLAPVRNRLNLPSAGVHMWDHFSCDAVTAVRLSTLVYPPEQVRLDESRNERKKPAPGYPFYRWGGGDPDRAYAAWAMKQGVMISGGIHTITQRRGLVQLRAPWDEPAVMLLDAAYSDPVYDRAEGTIGVRWVEWLSAQDLGSLQTWLQRETRQSLSRELSTTRSEMSTWANLAFTERLLHKAFGIGHPDGETMCDARSWSKVVRCCDRGAW